MRGRQLPLALVWVAPASRRDRVHCGARSLFLAFADAVVIDIVHCGLILRAFFTTFLNTSPSDANQFLNSLAIARASDTSYLNNRLSHV